MKTILFQKQSIGKITVEEDSGNGTRVIKRNNRTLSGSYVKTLKPTSGLYNFPHITELFPTIPRTVLCLGGGACVYPTYAIAQNSAITFDVIEIDPVVVQAARQYFPLPKERFNLMHVDGLSWMKKTKKTYDLVFVDVGIILSNTRSSNNRVFIGRASADGYRRLLGKSGILMINIITTVTSEDQKLIEKELSNVSAIYRFHFIFRENPRAYASDLQDIIHVYTNQDVSVVLLKKQLQRISSRFLSYPKKKYSEMLHACIAWVPSS